MYGNLVFPANIPNQNTRGEQLSVLNSAASTTSVAFSEHAPLAVGEEVTILVGSFIM